MSATDTTSGTTASDELRDAVGDVLGVDPELLGEASGPSTIAEWTSVKHVELMMVLEEVYGVVFPAREIGRLTTVAALRIRLEQLGAAVGTAADGGAGAGR